MAVLTFDIDRERRDIDVAKEIARLVPDATPFAVILMRARKQATQTSEFIWFEEEPHPYWTQINNAAGYTAADTNLNVVDGTVFAAKDLLKVPRTGEVMLVTAVNGNTITVTRGYAGTQAQALNHQDWVVNLGNALEERSRVPTEKIRQPVRKYNYTQIFRTPFGASGTSAAEAVRTSEDERTRLRRSKAIDHRLAIERAMLFGVRYEDNTGKRRTTGGLLSFITTNVFNVGGPLTERKFEEICEAAFSYGNGRKLLVASPRVMTATNAFAAGKIQVRSGEDTYGVRIAEYMTGHGLLRIVVSRALEKEYQGYGIIVDMDNIRYRPLDGRDTMLRTNIQPPDEDGWTDEYFTEAGLEVRLEKAHAVFYGVTA